MGLRLGIDVGGSRIKAGLVDQAGEVTAFTVIQFDERRGVEYLLKNLDDVRSELLKLAEINPNRIEGAGLGIPGVIDPEQGQVKQLNRLVPGLVGFPLSKYLMDRWQTPIKLENDARVFTMGEWRFGSGQGTHNFACITVGTGVGGGVIINNHLLRGNHSRAGIIGHLSIDMNGALCSCGNRGCLETYASASSLAAFAADNLRRGVKTILHDMSRSNRVQLDAKMVLEAARLGDVLASNLVRSFANALAMGIIQTMHAYDPELIAVGGGVMEMSGVFWPQVLSEVKLHAWTQPYEQIRVELAILGDRAGVIGAACLI